MITMAGIRVPARGESVIEARIGKWFKKLGDAAAVDKPLIELETDKVTIEVPGPIAGVLGDIAATDGALVSLAPESVVAPAALIARRKWPASTLLITPTHARRAGSAREYGRRRLVLARHHVQGDKRQSGCEVVRRRFDLPE